MTRSKFSVDRIEGSRLCGRHPRVPNRIVMVRSSDWIPTIRSFFLRIRRRKTAETVLSLPPDDSRGPPSMHAGEETLLVTRPTRLIALRYWTAMFVALILAGVFGFHVPRFFGSSALNYSVAGIDLGVILAGFFLFLALLAFLAAELKRKTIRYIITDNKIIREDGILNKNTEMIPYTQLERVDLHQSFGQRILKIGTIVVDTGDDTLSIDMVRHPAKVQALLSNRLGRRAWDGQTPPGQQAPQKK